MNIIARVLSGLVLVTATLLHAYGQEITIQHENKTTAVKNQGKSGTCWSFATLSFLESELLRMGKGTYDLSEMYIVRMVYPQKAERYIRLHGHMNFGEGGQAHDVLHAMKKHHILPVEAYPGLKAGDTMHNHTEMDAYLLAILKTASKPPKGASYLNWRQAVEVLLDAFLGSVPVEFMYKGKNYTPQTFSEMLGLNPNDYIEITSFMHQPWYQKFVLEVPDNWSSDSYYNVPLDDLMRIVDEALRKGYTIVWDGDVSDETRFSENNGIATTTKEESTVSPHQRQLAFDDFSTTDDHLMHITGIGTDATGKKYYLTKNSWGTTKGIEGYWWLSENFMRLKTVAIMVHKKAVPEDIARKMGL